jgi:hypothetical protein
MSDSAKRSTTGCAARRRRGSIQGLILDASSSCTASRGLSCGHIDTMA